jgi:arsenite oxidase small subunit
VLTHEHSPFPVTTIDERRLDRRRFLAGACAAAAVAVVGDRLGRRAEHALTTPADVEPTSLDGLAVGEARDVPAGDGRVAIAVRLDAETVVAFDRRCPHLGCPVRWSADRGRFECPCHHAAFEARTGAVLFGPPTRGLTPARGAA